MTPHRTGLLVTGFGGLVLSFDIPLLRLSDGEVWSVLFSRSFSTCLIMSAIWLAIRMARGAAAPSYLGGAAGIRIGGLYGITTIFFMLSVFNTTTANVAFILAFNPMFGALLSWFILGEKPGPVTVIAMLVMIAGMGLIVHDGMEASHTFGDLMAALAALASALAITLTRKEGADFFLAPIVSFIIPAAVAGAVVAVNGYHVAEPGWVIFNGLLVTPIAFWCLAIGPRWLSAAEVGMFYLLETILAPIWVWMLFAERPSTQVLAGGAIVLAALVGHSLLSMQAGARRG